MVAPPIDMCALVGVGHIAEHLGVTRDSIYRRIDRKHLPAHRVERLWKFKVKVGGCAWQHTAATGIGKGMIRNGIFAGIRLCQRDDVHINQYFTFLIDE